MESRSFKLLIMYTFIIFVFFAYRESQFLGETSFTTSSPLRLKTQILLGADVNKRTLVWSDVETPLMRAAAITKNPEIIKTLIKAGADINARSYLGTTAVIRSAENSNLAIFKTLIKAGAKLNKQDRKVALYAASRQNSNPDIILTIANFGIKETDVLNGALYNAASYNPNPNVVKTLIKIGADVNAFNSLNDKTPLMGAASSNPNLDIIKALIESGADVNIKNKQKKTALIHACDKSLNPEVIIALIEAGASVKDVSIENMYAIDYARLNPEINESKAYWKLHDLGYDTGAYND